MKRTRWLAYALTLSLGLVWAPGALGAEQLANMAESTVDEALDASETTVTVVDGSVFPATGTFRVVVDDELMVVSARAGDDLTVTRGAESTTATTHANGAPIAAVITAAGLDAFVDEAIAAAVWPSGTAFPGSPTTGQKFFRTNVRGGMLFTYDGTRWLSDELFVNNMPVTANLTSDSTVYAWNLPPDYSQYWVSWSGTYYLSAGSATWTTSIEVINFDEAGSGYSNIDTVSTATYGNTAQKWYTWSESLGSVITTTGGNTGGNDSGVRFVVDETAGAAGFYFLVSLSYRLIAT